MDFVIDYSIDAPFRTKLDWLKKRMIAGTRWDGHRTKQEAVTDADRDWAFAWNGDRLSDERIKTLIKGVALEIYLKDADLKRSVFTDRPIERSMQGLAVPLVREVLRRDPSIKSVLEIGANYGYILSVLAREFPHVKIHGSDLPWAMTEMNAEFSEPNLSFSSGYPLDEIESGKVRGDLVITVSTAVRIRGPELKRYFDALNESDARWFVANEVMIPHQNGVVPDPCSIDPDYSLPVIYKNSGAGMPPCYAHNYKAILESKGWTIEHYRIYAPLAPEEYRLELVARR